LKIIYNHKQDVWDSKCYVHKFNEKTKRHEINIKYGSATSFFIHVDDHDLELNEFDPMSTMTYLIKCHVKHNSFSNKKDIFYFNAIYYNNIYDVPNDVWLSKGYYNGDIRFITISYHNECNKKYIFMIM
jgi:hypothetical protein